MLPEFGRDLKIYTPYISAAILLIIAYLMPQGIAGLPGIISSWYAKRRESWSDTSVSGN
jgi:hypothetical protein